MARFRTTNFNLDREAIVAAYWDGQPAATIAQEAGCSREAIYMYLRQAGITSAMRYERLVDLHREAARDLYLQGLSMRDIKTVLALDWTVTRILAKEFTENDSLRRMHQLKSVGDKGKGQRRYTAGQLRRAVKQYHKQTGLTGIANYRKWRKGRNTIPHEITIINRFGSWNKALESCGFPANPKPKGMGTRHYDYEHMRVAALRVMHIVGRAPTHRDYEAHFIPGQEPHPETYRMRYKTWSKAMQAILGDVLAADLTDGREEAAIGEEFVNDV